MVYPEGLQGYSVVKVTAQTSELGRQAPIATFSSSTTLGK